MISSSISITIISLEHTLFSGVAHHIIAMGEMGELGIYPGHTPLLTYLKPGPVHIVQAPGNEKMFYVSEGFLEVQPNSVTLLAHTAISADCLEEATILQMQAQITQKIKQQQSKEANTTLLAQLSGKLNTIRRWRNRTQV